LISWIVGGTETSLDDRTLCYMLNHDGLGHPAFHRLEERGPLQDGVTDRGYRLDARTIMLNVAIKGSTLADYYDKRQELEGIFKPRTTAGKLRWTYDGDTRQIDGYCVGGLEWGGDRDRHVHKTVIVIRCPDPRWYDPTINLVKFALGGGLDTFVVPYEVPYKMGASTIDTDKTITYAGTTKSYPTIKITGPITDCIITNNTTGYKLDFTGVTIAAVDYYEINLGQGDNTIVDSAGDSVLADLSTDSDLVDFAIEADPDVTGGINSFNVSGSSISAATEIDITYYDRYIGI
jgi:hypothetical protein